VNLNLSNWIPDLFMKRVEADEVWSLFDPTIVPHFPDLVGEAFEAAYLKASYAPQRAAISWGSFTRFESTSNERMKRPIKDVIRYIFVTVASPRKSRKLWRCVTN
jgi:hypothetical protein